VTPCLVLGLLSHLLHKQVAPCTVTSHFFPLFYLIIFCLLEKIIFINPLILAG
jgi:hypothetical protein